MSTTSKELERLIELYEGVVVPEKIRLIPKRIGKILLAIDRSEISRSAVALTSHLAETLKAEVSIILVARPEAKKASVKEAGSILSEAEKALRLRAITATRCLKRGSPSEEVLKHADEYEPDLIILPSPYAERTEDVGEDSLGTVTDVILRRSPKSTILVRKPIPTPERVTKSIILRIGSVKEYKAVENALALAEEGATLLLLHVVGRRLVEETKAIAEELLEIKTDRAALESFLRKDARVLLASASTEARKRGVNVRRRYRVGDPVEITLEEIEKGGCALLVVSTQPAEKDVIGAAAYSMARTSSIPILIVKS